MKAPDSMVAVDNHLLVLPALQLAYTVLNLRQRNQQRSGEMDQRMLILVPDIQQARGHLRLKAL